MAPISLDTLGCHLVRVMSDLPGTTVLTWEQMADSDRDEARQIASELAEAFLPELTPPRRVFFARVALMGHRDLGLCRIEESSLGGQDVLRTTTLTEVPEADALAQAEEAREERARQAAAKVRRDQERAEEIARVRALRVGAYLLITTTEDGVIELRALRDGECGPEGVADALRTHHPDAKDALQAAKVGYCATSNLYEGAAIFGFSLYAPGRAGAIARAFETLGFDRIERTGPQADQDDESEPQEVEF